MLTLEVLLAVVSLGFSAAALAKPSETGSFLNSPFAISALTATSTRSNVVQRKDSDDEHQSNNAGGSESSAGFFIFSRNIIRMV